MRVPYHVRKYAEYLTSYIADPSTVRVRLIENYGIDTPIPTKAMISDMRAKHVLARQRLREKSDRRASA